MIYDLRFVPFILIGILALVVSIRNAMSNKFSEKESILWAVAAVIMILSPLYMGFVDRLVSLVGVEYPPSLIFAFLFLFVFFLLYRQSAATHRMNEKLVELIQLNAIYENELRALKEKVNDKGDTK